MYTKPYTVYSVTNILSIIRSGYLIPENIYIKKTVLYMPNRTLS
jgi:hypothetical protein